MKFCKKSIKTIITRKQVKPDIEFTPKICGFCGRVNRLFTYDLEINHQNREVSISGAHYEPERDLHYCFSTPAERATDGVGECRGKKLNPNSAEYVQVTNGLPDREAALALIHSRNASPFYSENHDSEAAYANFQREQFYGRDLHKVREGIEKIQDTREKNETAMGAKRSGFSAITREDGHVLRSNGERFFYRYAKEIGISEFLDTNGFYPDSYLCYDFHIPIIGKFIEIAGLEGEKYNSRILEKQEKFGAIVIKHLRTNRYFEQDCRLLLDGLRKEIEHATNNIQI